MQTSTVSLKLVEENLEAFTADLLGPPNSSAFEQASSPVAGELDWQQRGELISWLLAVP